GQLSFGQTLGSLDLVRPLGTRLGLQSLSFVGGGEFRREEYRIDAGEEASWQLGNGGDSAGVDFDTTSAGAPKESGAQVFPGFQPANELDRSRNSLGVYAGLESQVTDRFLMDVAGRFESYSDFGRTFNGKVAARLELAPSIALRGAASTGFRAPSLAQVWFNNVSNQFTIDASGNLILNPILTSHNQIRVRILNPEDRNRLEDGLPRQKGSVQARWQRGRFGVLGRTTYYGSIEYHHPTNPANDEHFGAKTLVDLDLSYELLGGVRLAVGGSNIFNTYPDQQVKPANVSFGRFIYSRRVTQFGMNGGFYYARLALSL